MATSRGGYLGQAYGLEDGAATQDFYRGWAETYEQEIRDNGYVTPQRCAEALVHCGAERSAPLLDLGCGTGLAGEAFRDVGFTTLDGSDFSREMLAVARAKSGLYRSVLLADLEHPIPAGRGDYACVAAVGVFSPGHAPPATLDAVLELLLPGGLFVFSLNDHALAEPAYEAAIRAATGRAAAEVAFHEHGPHLPGIGLEASVYVLRAC